MTELYGKFTYECQAIFLDQSRICIGIEITHRIPQHLIWVISRPTESDEPVYGFSVQNGGNFNLVDLLLKKLFVLKKVIKLWRIWDFFHVLTDIRPPRCLWISSHIRSALLAFRKSFMSGFLRQIPSFAPHLFFLLIITTYNQKLLKSYYFKAITLFLTLKFMNNLNVSFVINHTFFTFLLILSKHTLNFAFFRFLP